MTNPTIMSGMVSTSSELSARKVVDMAPEIAMLHPETTQFTTMLMKLGSRPATRERIDWLEDQLFPRLVTLSASATSAATTIAVATGDSAVLKVNDLLRVQTSGECLQVTAVGADSSITVTRSIGSVAAATAASGDQVLIIGNTFDQGADVPSAKVTQVSNQYNYTQIFRHSWNFSNTQAEIELYGEGEPNRERAKKLVEHKRALEYSVFWGARDQTGSQGQMGGAFEYISTNVHSESGSTLTAAELDQTLIDHLQYCVKPVLFVSPIVAYNFSQMAASDYRTNTVGDQRFGFVVDAFISGAYGFEIPIVVKRDWNEFASASGQFGGWAFLIDMSQVSLRPLRNRSTKLLTNRQGNGIDGVTEEYLTEVSLQFELEKHHGIIKGVTKT